MRSPHVLAVGVLVACLGGARAADERPDLGPEEKVLRDAGVGTDGPALVDYIRRRTLTDADRKNLADMVRRLGHNDFEEREKASEALFNAGRAAVPFLTRAIGDKDVEVDRRARDCLERIRSGKEQSVLSAAARLLAARKPDGADRALLDFLPSASDDFIEDAAVAALEAVGVKEGRPTVALKAALQDREPLRRGAAAQVIALHCAADRPAVAKLLTDADTRVRYRAAAALARIGDRRAMPVLIALLTDGSSETAWQVEELLLRLAGEQPPAPALETADAERRKKCRDAWAAWWRDNETKVDLARLGQDESRVLRVVCEMQGYKNGGRVVAFGMDDKVRWQVDGVSGAMDFQVLPGGHVLVAEINTRKVTERDRDGKVLFEYQTAEGPMTCLRLPSGNTFIATYHEVLEVTRDGKVVYALPRLGQSIYCAQKLRNGNILTLDAGGKLIEFTTTGKEVRRVEAGDTSNWGGFELLPNGHFIVARCGKHEVVEIDAAGKVVWRIGGDKIQWPTWAGRLANGRTLVACAHSGVVAEFDRAGNKVWEMKLENRPCRLRRY